LIDDGYTLDGEVKANGWPKVAVKYRPALPAQTRDFVITRGRASTGPEEMKAVVALLKKHVLGWDIEEVPGKPAPVSEYTINRVPDPVLQRIIDLVTGYGPEQAAEDEKNSASG